MPEQPFESSLARAGWIIPKMASLLSPTPFPSLPLPSLPFKQFNISMDQQNLRVSKSISEGIRTCQFASAKN